MTDADIIIIGAGIAGAALGHALLVARPGLKLIILEAESQPGYHTTGRSAAFFAETYGGPIVQPLTTASRPFLAHPPADFHDRPLLSPRGALHVARQGRQASLQAQEDEFRHGHVTYRRLDAVETRRMMPHLRENWAQVAIYEPGCTDIDVAALHQACLGYIRRSGSRIVCDAAVQSLDHKAGLWRAGTTAGQFVAPLVVNAAGAWVDAVAQLAGLAPIGIQPKRRTIAVVEVFPPAPPDLPMVMDADGELYFKPDGGRLWISPHDEIPDVARDVRPEEIDVALALDRFQQMCDWPLGRLVTSWAGLRNFAPDRQPLLGPDPEAPTFFWCAGQGGWGIQTAPAASAVLAGLILQQPLAPPYQMIDNSPYLPRRLR